MGTINKIKKPLCWDSNKNNHCVCNFYQCDISISFNHTSKGQTKPVIKEVRN